MTTTKKQKTKRKQTLNQKLLIEQKKKERYQYDYKLYKRYLKDRLDELPEVYDDNFEAIIFEIVGRFIKTRRNFFSIGKPKLIKTTIRFIKALKKKRHKRQLNRLFNQSRRCSIMPNDEASPVWFVEKVREEEKRPVLAKYLTKEYEVNKNEDLPEKVLEQINIRTRIKKMENVEENRYSRCLPMVLQVKGTILKKKWNKKLEPVFSSGEKVLTHNNQCHIKDHLVRVIHHGKIRVIPLSVFKGIIINKGEKKIINELSDKENKKLIRSRLRKLGQSAIEKIDLKELAEKKQEELKAATKVAEQVKSEKLIQEEPFQITFTGYGANKDVMFEPYKSIKEPVKRSEVEKPINPTKKKVQKAVKL